MKQYILFTLEELDDLMNGREIELPLKSGEILYFMCVEHYNQTVKGDK